MREGVEKSNLLSPEATGSSLKGTEKDLTFSEKYVIIYIENERRDNCEFRHLFCAAVIEERIVLIAQTMLPKERRSTLAPMRLGQRPPYKLSFQY